jgi:hypothetical protein
MTEDQISALTERQIDKFLALANSRLAGEKIIPSLDYPGVFVLIETGGKAKKIEEVDLAHLITLSGVPDIPDFWPDHLQSEWPPTYMDGGETLFDDRTYWAIENREYERKSRIADAPQYFTGDNAWEEADAAARAATEESGGEQEWEVVGVAGREPTYSIRPVDLTLPPVLSPNVVPRSWSRLNST